MTRVLGILAVVMLCAAPARADTDVIVNQTDILLSDMPGTWAQETWEYDVSQLEDWVFHGDDGTTATLWFAHAASDYPCPVLGPNLAYEEADLTRFEKLPAKDGKDRFSACAIIGRTTYLVFVEFPEGDDLQSPPYEPVMVVLGEYLAALVARDGPVTHEAPAETNGPTTLYLPTSGLTIAAPSSWSVESVEDGDGIAVPGGVIGTVLLLPGTCSEGIDQFNVETRSPTVSLSSSWAGVEYYVEGIWMGFYCYERGDGVLTVNGAVGDVGPLVDAVAVALDPPSSDANIYDTMSTGDGGSSEPYVESPRPGARPWIPKSFQLGLVRRAGDMTSGFGFGLGIGRMPWEFRRRFALGWDVSGAAATGFWNAGAQLRPGVSPMAKDLPADAYLVLGVDARGGKNEPDTDVAPVAGAGAEVLFTLPGIGAELGGQVLADPDGLHSYTLRGGVLFGGNRDAKVRAAVTYVRFADDTSLTWFTLGLTRFQF